MSNTKSSKQVGWYGETLNAILDGRKPAQPGTKPAPVGYDPAALAKLLG